MCVCVCVLSAWLSPVVSMHNLEVRASLPDSSQFYARRIVCVRLAIELVAFHHAFLVSSVPSVSLHVVCVGLSIEGETRSVHRHASVLLTRLACRTNVRSWSSCLQVGGERARQSLHLCRGCSRIDVSAVARDDDHSIRVVLCGSWRRSF